jgi:hypothetical protein
MRRKSEVTHRIIIIESATPPVGESAVASVSSDPAFKVRVEIAPPDSYNPAQIGNEVARVQRLVNRIIEGGVD